MTGQQHPRRYSGTALLPVAGLVLGFVAASFVQAGAHGAKHNPTRFRYLQKHGIPEVYKNLKSPVMTKADISKGATLFAENCASCHGATGEGDGEAGKDLNPKPPALRSMMDMMAMMRQEGHAMKGMKKMMGMMNNNPDGYLIWTVSEGGAAMNTAMPAFKDILSEKERWQVISYMLDGFKAKAGKN